MRRSPEAQSLEEGFVPRAAAPVDEINTGGQRACQTLLGAARLEGAIRFAAQGSFLFRPFPCSLLRT